MTPRRILLVGGGHAHIEVLRRLTHERQGAAQVTLVAGEARAMYSGMLPGVVAGHYAPAEAEIDLAPLAAAAGAGLVVDRVVRLDLYTRIAHLAGGSVVSLDVGSTPDLGAPGVRAHALPVKPVDRFLAAWDAMQTDAIDGRVRTIAVVGGGVAGVEILLAMQYRLAELLGPETPRFALVTDQPQVAPRLARAARRALGRVLIARDVVQNVASPALAVEEGAIVTTAGRRIAADRVVWTTAAVGAPWLRACELDCDEQGFVRVNRFLQSTSHPFVFAAGDCATQEHYLLPKSGVLAVRHGPALAANLARIVADKALRPFRPPQNVLAIVATGDRQAVASRGGLSVAGAWVWRWKERIDRRFVARYRVAPVPA